ncbi:MAG: polysaccharide biosynthesis/export family protein [Verrucomicrobiae bacterium]|nr:polysaccharide biosynthesis/export family protein [Verrucomicrobiae bacterium]
MNTPTALRKDSMMTRAQGSLRMIWLGLISCLAMVLAGCSMPRNDFDVRDETQLIGDEPDFLSLDLARPLPPETLRPPQAPYRVGPGDTLDIEVAEDANTRAASKVMPDGMLYFDVADGIKVSGKTLKEVSDALAASLAKDYPSPVVTVNLADAQSQRFFILGQVKTPGAYPIAKPTTLIEAISLAGGLDAGQNFSGDSRDSVDLDRATLIRDGDLLPVDYRGLIEHGDMGQNVYIKPGDYLYLPSIQHRAVYVLGSVQTPGPVYFDNDPTILSAVAMAGGPRQDAIINKALVIRGSLKQPKVATVNLHDIIRGKESDARLAAGDIVWVPNTIYTYLREYTQAALVTAAQAVAVQQGLSVLGKDFGGADVTISAGGF